MSFTNIRHRSNQREEETAFPADYFSGKEGQRIETPGMTLRDYFAAKAMQVLEWKTSDAPFSSVAKNAYELADAMLKQREQ